MPDTVVLTGGTVFDGSGGPRRPADVAVQGDRIVAVAEQLGEPTPADVTLDVTGLAICPGFINVLSHAWGSLQTDGSGASDLFQGVTTEVFGEAFSLGPSDDSFAELVAGFGAGPDIRVTFDRLSEGLDYLEGLGVAPNIASFVGGTNLRMLAAGFDDRRLTLVELDRLRGVLSEEMQEGALGVGTALIYPPGRFADTAELTALCQVVGEFDGMYISHLRSEGDQFLQCLEELLVIGRTAPVRTEVYHLKAAGRHNWHKMAQAIDLIQTARASGQDVAANMYPYEAGGTALAASIPPSFHVGGPAALLERLADPEQSRLMAGALRELSDDFENLYLAAGAGEGVLFLSDLADGTPAQGKRLSELVGVLGCRDEAEALLEAVRRDPAVGVAYFIIDEDNIRMGLRQPWVSIGSDAAAHDACDPWTGSATHPRTYGSFAKFLGRYCRDEQLFGFAEGVRRLTSLPADRLRLADRGRVQVGAYADLVALDPAEIRDLATYENPHQLSTGVRHVLVNGQLVIKDGALTGARPGRRLRRAG
ncbi:MAG: amidohydrolase family protein [Actinomycetota bacterium]|nr:amidohydrolase family protein [Actinomycetota bacterium]